jgi:hypothetical protein
MSSTLPGSCIVTLRVDTALPSLELLAFVVPPVALLLWRVGCWSTLMILTTTRRPLAADCVPLVVALPLALLAAPPDADGGLGAAADAGGGPAMNMKEC